MRILVVALIGMLAACTKANPNTCCVTEAQCADLGVDDTRPCKAGQACAADFTCVASECSDSADCTSPDAPVCVNNLCVASCSADADCAGSPSGPLCADDGVCVGCMSNEDCDATAPLCDQEDRACRGCEKDSECASGVCLEADAICVETDGVAFVSPSGVDTGNCRPAAPCKSIGYAVMQSLPAPTPGRFVIHVDGGSTDAGPDPLNVGSGVYLDGTDTVIEGGSTSTVFTVNQGGFTASGITIPAGTGNAITATALTAKARLFNVTLRKGVDVTNGTVEATRSTLSGVHCMSGTLTIRDSLIEDSLVETMSCQTTVAGNRFENRTRPAFQSFGGLVTFENNLVIISDQYIDAVALQSGVSGSTARFNTIVSTTTVTTSDTALGCDTSIDVTSNIIAYNSTSPLVNNGCVVKYTLFDAPTEPRDSAGEGNKVGDASTFFVDRAAKDFHLAPESPARDAAQASLPVTDDFDGNRRPVGAAPDMGAFEAP